MRAIYTLILLVALSILNYSSTALASDKNWMNEFDFDGDYQNDTIEYSFSGGAHCCYTISVILTKTNSKYYFPFEIDGGYIGGLDLSQENNFFIKDYDNDKLPEIFMHIHNCNNVNYPIPLKWIIKYGILSNYILIDYKNNKLKVLDFNKNN